MRVGRYTITCSASPYSRKVTEPYPDFGIYMSKYSWEGAISPFWTSGAYLKAAVRARRYPALVVDWPDGGVIEPRLLKQVVNVALSKLRHGKSLDIGCMAGHGRTGTLLACLVARVEHLSARRAIQEVRQRYCKSAIETKKQEEAVGKYVKIMGVRVRK